MPDSLSDHLKKRPEYRDASRKARLSYLYSDLSQARINNPTSYASSVSWWITLLEEIVSKGLQDGGADVTETTDKLVWHLDQSFLDRLRWDGAGRPTGLGTVTMHMSQTSPATIIPLKAFQTSTRPIAHFSWPAWLASKMVAAPFWWSLEKLGLTDSNSSLTEAKAWKASQGDWVMMNPLKTAAENVISRLPRDKIVIERMYTLDTFTDTFANIAIPGVKLTASDILILLQYLQRDRSMTVKDGEIIKCLSATEEAQEGITDAEKGILQVKSTSETLEKQINDLENRISERQATIAKYVKSKQKDLALSHLRSKKALEDVLSKRTLAYENLHAVLLKIEAAETDVAILSAYSSATASLKSLLSHPDLQRDHVENTMEALQDALADQKEIEDIVTEGGKQAAGLENAEDEIQAELEALELEAKAEKEKEKEEAAQQSQKQEVGTVQKPQSDAPLKLPNVPSKDPAAPSKESTPQEKIAILQ